MKTNGLLALGARVISRVVAGKAYHSVSVLKDDSVTAQRRRTLNSAFVVTVMEILEVVALNEVTIGGEGRI